MKTALVAVVCFASGLFVQDAKEVMEYEFDPPAFPADAAGTVFMHFMPPENGFAANINCMVQPYAGSLNAYDNLSTQQFKAMGLEVVMKRKQGNTLTYEYKGNQQNRDLHWYAKAHKTDDKMVLVTATMLAQDWETKGPTLKASVDSFTLKDEKAGGLN